MTTKRRATLVAVVGAALLAPTALAQTVQAPRSGSTYKGSPGRVAIAISGDSMGLVAFGFRCRSTTGRTSLNDVALKRTSKGYAFAARVSGNVTFADGRPDENAAIRLEGRFSRTARSVRGRFRVSSRRCRTGYVDWTARRVSR